MALSATERLDDAYDATREFLLPVDAGTWVRLAVMTFFVGGVTSGISGNAGLPGDGGNGGDPAAIQPIVDLGQLVVQSQGAQLAVFAVAVAALLVALLFMYVGSVMEFVFLEALLTREAVVRERFSARRWQGTRLFGFRIALFLAVAIPVAGAVALGVALQGPGVRVLAVLFAVPVLLVLGVAAAIVHGFTNVFVVPIMFEQRCGVLEGWRRLRPAVSDQLDEFGVYLVLSVVLGAVGGAVVATVVGIAAVVLFLPVGVLGVAALVSGGGPLLLLLVPVALAVLFALAAIGAVVSVPVLTYLRYYALFVLGDTTEYDLLGASDDAEPGEPGPETPA